MIHYELRGFWCGGEAARGLKKADGVGCGWRREFGDCEMSTAIGKLKLWGCIGDVITYQNTRELGGGTYLKSEGVNPPEHQDQADRGQSWPLDGGKTLGRGP